MTEGNVKMPLTVGFLEDLDFELHAGCQSEDSTVIGSGSIKIFFIVIFMLLKVERF